jgi:hypothetical protein
MSKKLLLFLAAIAVLALAGLANAVEINNSGFEEPKLSPDDWTWLWVPGWTWVGGEGPGVWHVTAADFDQPIAPEGKNVLYTENAVGDAGGVAQVLTETFAADIDYTLTVEVGNSNFYYFAGYSVQLLAGGVVIADDNDTVWPDYYKWATSTVEYTYNPADAALVGQPLEIRLLNLALDKDNPPAGSVVGVEFDKVTLTLFGPMAMNPVPADGAEHDMENVNLSWTPGKGALEHDVYFGTNFDDVNDANSSWPVASGPTDPNVYKGRQTDTSYYVDVLVPGTTYYWRIDEVNDTDPCSPYKGVVWSFWLSPWEPTNPIPPDGAMYMDPNIDLSWSAGFAATTHEVFFGTDPCALVSFPRATLPFDPGTLLMDTTYYWQVEETYKAQKHIGPIWSFSTTLPTMGTCLYEYWDGITPEGASLSLLYNWPDFPGNPTDTNELTLFEGPTDRAEQFGARIQAWLYAPVTGDYKFWIATDDNGELYLSTDDDPANKQLISWVSAWATPRNWADPDITPSGLIPLVAGQKYYIEGLMKEAGGGDNIAVGWTTPFDDTIQVITGNYLERYVQIPAWNPSPADGAIGVPRPITLRWLPGAYAAQHQVYFGTSEASMTLQDTLPLGTEEYDPPGTLDVGQTYYWKVNEVNVAGPDPFMWEGDVWSFTVTVFEYLVVDNMEDYNDRTSIITVWRDGWRGAGFAGDSGSNVTISTESDGRDPRLDGDGPPWPVRDSEAMQFAYDNDGSITLYVPGYLPYSYSADANYYSEAKAGIANLPIGTTNWTEGGVKALTLWFYGDADNDIEPMWVKLTDQVGGSGKVTYGDYGEDPNDLKDPSWHEWNIALSDFGVDLTQVKDISIGFGDESNHTTPGGSGVVFFDDIRLYTPRCILSLRSADFARADFVEDCVVDDKEFEIIVENWLAAEPIMLPITIDNPGFEAELRGDGTYNYAHQGWGWFANAEELGTWNPGLVGEIGYGGDAPEGQNVGWVNPGGVGVPGGFAQVLTETLKADTTYKLTVEVGNTLAYPWGGYSVQLLAGGTPGDTGEITVGTLLAEDANSLTIAVDTFETSTVTYTYNPALHSHLLGEPLQIRLLSLGNVSAGDYTEADFDDVQLFRSIKLYEDMIINFKDYSLIASKFLEEEMFP